jgi:endonuclease III
MTQRNAEPPLEERVDATRQRAQAIMRELRAVYPDAKTELAHHNPFELLIATILSAQATDKSVNAASPGLFGRFPDAATMAQATPEDLEPLIRSIGLYRNKAKNCVATARALHEHFGGEVPEDFDAVLSLPGVGRKTAAVVMANAFGRPAIAVDTHVGRLSRRLGLSEATNPDKVQRDLEEVFAPEDWIFLHNALIFHGRRVCLARTPACEVCTLHHLCPSSRV